MHLCTPAIRCTPSNFIGPKDVQGCSAVPEEFSPTAFLAVFLSRGSQRVCVCVCGNRRTTDLLPMSPSSPQKGA